VADDLPPGCACASRRPAATRPRAYDGGVTVLPIRLVGDPILRRPAEPVIDFDAELRTLVADLRETLADRRGAGLAAPQLGVGRRVFVIAPQLVDDGVDHLVNPVLDFPDDQEQDGPEGCLSIPGVYLDTKRRRNVVAKGFTAHGDPVQVVGDGLLSRCIQHETDHLDGVLFIDRQDTARQGRLLATLREAAWAGPALFTPAVKLSPH
jgi:peptide deformylase